MLFYGPSGAGKKTRITATLRQLFGAGVEKACTRYQLNRVESCADRGAFVEQLKIDQRVFMTPSKRKLDVNIVQSNFHIEITPRWVSHNLRGISCDTGRLVM